MSSTMFSDRVTDVTYDLLEPLVIGEMFGPKARAWFEKWKKSIEFKQIESAERMAYRRLREKHPTVLRLNRRTLIGRKFLEDRERLYKQFERRVGKMPSDTRRNALLSGIKAT